MPGDCWPLRSSGPLSEPRQGLSPCVASQSVQADRLFSTAGKSCFYSPGPVDTAQEDPRTPLSGPPSVLLLALGRAPPPQFCISRIPDRGHPLHRSALTDFLGGPSPECTGGPGFSHQPPSPSTSRYRCRHCLFFPSHPLPLNSSRVDSALSLHFPIVPVDDSASSTRLILINRPSRWHTDHPVLGSKRSDSTRLDDILTELNHPAPTAFTV